MAYRVRGVLLPDERDTELWIDDAGLLSADPLPGAQTLTEGGWIVPGLVDAHCHVGLGPAGRVELDEAAEQAATDRDAGTLLIRDCGSPLDTRPLQRRADLPEIIRAGRHLSRPKRYVQGFGPELDDPALLPEAVVEQAKAGDGWVKLVGDWIDRSVGDLAPLWPDEVLVEAIAAAHAHGARVTAHVFGADAIPGLLAAGIDCIEHGCGLTADMIDDMVAAGTALVPTLINVVENFPAIAERAEKYPRFGAHLRRLRSQAPTMVRNAVEAGVAVYAGSDAGGGVKHGRIVDEVVALRAAGMPPADALGAASWAARGWLGRPGLQPGARADLIVYPGDPRADLAVLHEPSLIMLRGRPVTGSTQPQARMRPRIVPPTATDRPTTPGR